MSTKPIIISLVIFLILSFSFLGWRESRMESLSNQNWWSIYFTDAKNKSLNFTIENNSDVQNFYWELMIEKNKVKEGNVQVNKGEKKEINFINSDFQNYKNQKIIIKVSDSKESKEIYKIF